MSFEEFTNSLAADQPPTGLPPALEALWHERRGNWERAHELAQADAGRDGDWVHAYLHRREGDLTNAGYWYARAGQPISTSPLDDEWAAVARALAT